MNADTTVRSLEIGGTTVAQTLETNGFRFDLETSADIEANAILDVAGGSVVPVTAGSVNVDGNLMLFSGTLDAPPLVNQSQSTLEVR